MTFTRKSPFPKQKGHVLKSGDWNDAIDELQRLDRDKVNKAGDDVTGQLTVAGNLGVGTTNPTTGASGGRALHVDNPNGASALRLGDGAANGQQWEWQSTVINNAGAMNLSKLSAPTSNPFTVLANGNVGVGTTTPNSKLVVSGPSKAISMDATDNNPNAAGALGFNRNVTDGQIFNSGFTAYQLSAYKAGLYFEVYSGNGSVVAGQALAIASNGNVGIGTANPGAKLDVSGSGGASQCCAPVAPTLSLAEASSTANRQAWLQLHNAGEAEAYIRLAGGGPAGGARAGQRRIEIGDNQGANTALQVLSNSNPLRFTASWNGFPDAVANQAEISNDTGTYKTLMIVGNRSGGGVRKVSVWDRLEVNGTFQASGEVRLGASDAPVYIGGNQTGIFMALHDDLWFSDPQTGSIEIKNGNNSNWGRMVGIFAPPSSIEYKKDVSVLNEPDLTHLLHDVLSTDIVRYRYKGDGEGSRLRLGVIVEDCPQYLVGEDAKSLSSTEYIAMIHGAVKALVNRVNILEKSLGG